MPDGLVGPCLVFSFLQSCGALLRKASRCRREEATERDDAR
jgi:hypothetical protein